MGAVSARLNIYPSKPNYGFLKFSTSTTSKDPLAQKLWLKIETDDIQQKVCRIQKLLLDTPIFLGG